MSNPPRDLSKHFSHTMILAAAGINVKGVMPELTECPFCHIKALAIHADPMSANSSWLYCHNCLVKGDTLEFYGRLHNITDIRQMLRRATAEGVTDPDLDASDAFIESYETNYSKRRQIFEKAWEKLRSYIWDGPPPSDVVHHLQTWNMWGSFRRASAVRFKPFLGGGTRKEIEKLFDGRRFLPETGFSSALALNYQDVPGRTSAIRFLNQAGESAWRFASDAGGTVKEGGLCGLNLLLPEEGTVFAFGDIDMGLQLQRLWLLNSAEPLKLVLFNEYTNVSWNSVNAERVILWDKKITWRLFDQARKVQNAHIAVCPRPTSQRPYAYLSDMSAPVVLDIMRRSAKPWQEVFIDWLTGSDTTDSEAREAINHLALSIYDRNTILEKCPTTRRVRLEMLLENVRVSQRAVFNRHTVLEQEDGWWLYYSKSGRELVSDAVIKVKREICHTTSGRIYWHGSIRFKGQNIAFTDPLEEIENDVVAWLRKHTTKAGLGTPIVKSNWTIHLTVIAKTFSNPQAVVSSVQLGLQSSGEFILPRFRMIGGQVIEDPCPLSFDGSPALDVMPPRPKELPNKILTTESVTPARAFYIALAATYVINQVRRMRGMQPRPVAVVGGPGSIAYAAMRHFASQAGMKNVLVESLSGLNTLRIRLNDMDYPYYVEAKEDSYLRDWPNVNSDFAYISCGEIIATSLATGGGWLILKAPQVKIETSVFPGFDETLNLIMNLQTRGFALPHDLPFAAAVLEHAVDFVSVCEGLPLGVLLHHARQVFYTPSAGESLLDLTFELIRIGHIRVVHEHFLHQILEAKAIDSVSRWACRIVVDDTEGMVHIPRAGLINGCKRLHITPPDITTAISDLARHDHLRPGSDTGEGWVIEQKYWEERALAWRGRNTVTPEIKL